MLTRGVAVRGPRLQRLIGVLVCLTATGIAGFLYAGHAFRSAELSTVDKRFALRGTQAPPDDIVVIGINNATFADLRTQWPFPRSYHARLIDRLRRDGARVIAFSLEFSESSTRKEDLALVTAARRAGNVVLPTTAVSPGGQALFLAGGLTRRYARVTPSYGQLPTDPGGVIRRFDFGLSGLKGFPVAIAEVYTGRPIRKDELGGQTPWIDYAGPTRTIRTVSYSQALRGELPPSTFRGKAVLIGATASALQDLQRTSVSDKAMPTTEIYANAVSSTLRGVPLRRSPTWVDLLLIAALGFVPQFTLRRGLLVTLAVGALTAGAYVVAAQLAFNSGRIIPLLYPLIALGLSCTVGPLILRYTSAVFERERVRDLFARFAPESVVAELLEQTRGGTIPLGAVRREGTVLFCDLRGFTSFSERVPPDTVIDVLNTYYTLMSETILEQEGTLVAYMADGIMAVFGAPLELSDHADRALRAARTMLARLDDFNAYVRGRELGDGFRMGIGVNSGTVMSGNVGSERRLEYTVLGDAANTAARLEAMTKDTPYQLFVADSTRSRLSEAPPDLISVGDLSVRGREATVAVWSLAGDA